MERLYELLPAPVIIETISVLRIEKKLLVRAQSRDGAAGYALANERLHYLLPILQELIIPYFTGKDARNLAALVDGVYSSTPPIE